MVSVDCRVAEYDHSQALPSIILSLSKGYSNIKVSFAAPELPLFNTASSYQTVPLT